LQKLCPSGDDENGRKRSSDIPAGFETNALLRQSPKKSKGGRITSTEQPTSGPEKIAARRRGWARKIRQEGRGFGVKKNEGGGGYHKKSIAVSITLGDLGSLR